MPMQKMIGIEVTLHIQGDILDAVIEQKGSLL